jgi:hypothetical protein
MRKKLEIIEDLRYYEKDGDDMTVIPFSSGAVPFALLRAQFLSKISLVSSLI